VSKGFFTIAQGKTYQRLAYALALSLKLSQKEHSKLSIGVSKEEISKMPKKYKEVFDEVVEIPWGDHAKDSQWKLENEWKAIFMSPYDETIKLDADMFFPQDIGGWWHVLEQSEGVFATEVRTYTGDKVTSDFYRKTFTKSNLPNIYTAFFYFKKTKTNFDLFKLAGHIFDNWERYFYEFLDPEDRPTIVSTDVVFALAAKIMDYQDLNRFPTTDVPTFVHMKSQLQGWPVNGPITENWPKMITTSFNKTCELKVGNYLQVYPFHYYIKDFMTDRMIKQMEDKLGV
jgi:hypothetical protein